MTLTNTLRLSAALATLAIALIAKAETYAIVLGINDYPETKSSDGKAHRNALRGCVNDANTISELLTKSYGASESNITILRDKECDADHIVPAFKDTFGKLKAGDQFVFFYSGHGTRVSDPDSKDPDGKGSAIVLVDFSFIRGKLFGSIAHQLKDLGVRSTFVFDSCYSGGMSRDPVIYGIDGARAKYIDGAELGAKVKEVKLPELPESELFLASMNPKAFQATGNYAFIYASQYDVTSIDLPGNPEKNLLPHGLFTYALTSVMTDSPKAPVGDMIDAIKGFFDKAFEGKDIKQRPSDEFSDPDRAKDPIFYGPSDVPKS